MYFVISNHPCCYPCALIFTSACAGAGERSVLCQSRSRAGGRECEHRQWSTPSTVVNISSTGQHSFNSSTSGHLRTTASQFVLTESPQHHLHHHFIFVRSRPHKCGRLRDSMEVGGDGGAGVFSLSLSPCHDPTPSGNLQST